MRIYLDNCVLQDLKVNNILFDAVCLNKRSNIYTYSEAHIMDLLRDKSEQKFKDAEFIEKIVDDNCWLYDKGTTLSYITPTEHLSNVSNNIDDTFNIQDTEFCGLFKSILEITPCPWDQTSFNELTDNYPTQLKSLYSNSSNMYEFMTNMLDLSDSLAEEQKEFKSILSYLHSSIYSPLYKMMGIEGYGESRIEDKIAFRESFINYHKKTYPNRNFQEHFLDMYCNLEFMGLVKGKPRKQKMMNFINDAKHAFFGAYCDMVVSKDVDFLNKSRFIYDLFDIKVPVLSIEEFSEWLKNNQEHNFTESFVELQDDFTTRIIQEDKTNGVNTTVVRLRNIYHSYFNIFIIVSDKCSTYYYLTKEYNNYCSNTLVKEIQHLVSSLFKILGNDIFNKGEFEQSEINHNGKWEGRCWDIEDFIVSLNYQSKLQLTIYPKQYLVQLEREVQLQTNSNDNTD